MKKLTQTEFINKAKEKFPSYDFSKAIYVNNKTKVIVICPKHGEFSIRPDCLLTGTGCPYCGGTKKNTTETFIEKAKYVHNMNKKRRNNFILLLKNYQNTQDNLHL